MLVVVALFALGCAQPAGNVAAPAPVAPATVNPMIVASAGTGGLIVIETAALAATPLGRKLAPRLRAAVDADGSVERVCQIDVAGVIETLWIGIPDVDTQRGAVAIRGGDRPALESCVQRIYESQGVAMEMVAEGRVAVVHAGDQEKPLFAAWLDRTTVLMTVPPDDRAALDALLAATPAPAPEIAPLVARIDRGATAWAALSARRVDFLAPIMGTAPRGAYAWVHHADDVRATVGIAFTDAAAANAAAGRSREWLDAAAGQAGLPPEFLKAVTIEVVAADLVAHIALDAGQIDKLAALLNR